MNLVRQVSVSVFSLFLLLISMAQSAAHDNTQQGRFFGAMNTDYPPWFKQSFLDIREDIAEAKTNNRRVMLLFHQDGCPYCNALVERNLSQKHIESRIRNHFDVIAINLWGDREVTGLDGKQYTEKSFAEALRVQFTPTILFFDEQGNIILRLNGYRPPQRFMVDLDYVIERQEQKQSYREYLQQQPTAATPASQLIDEPYLRQSPVDLQKARNISRPFAVFFEQKDCPNCEDLHGKILPDEKLQQTLRDFDLFQLDMWSTMPLITPDGRHVTARDWAQELKIQYAPSIVLFNANAEEIIRLEGFFKVFHTRGVFQYVRSGAYRQQPNFQRYLSDFADTLREQGEDVNIWRFSDEALAPSETAQ